MRLYNTLTKQISDIEPLDGETLRIYSCGPTVYNHIHIGNLSSFIFADTLRRTLRWEGFKVKHVMNFTDVDDKTITRSRDEFPDEEPMAALKQLTKKYSDIFLSDMSAAGNDVSGIQFVKATDSITQMQQLIRQLVDGGYAYIADDGIYFSIQKYVGDGKSYGQLTEVTTSSTSSARIQNDEYDKASAHDFALWKSQKEDEPAWDFDIKGQNIKGRPGWHIECSAMSAQALGLPFDIHTGGVDLKFPHHENEIAQSTAGQTDAVYAKVFAHNEHLLVDGQKMSKSLNNFYTLEDIRAKGYDPLAFRILVLQAHYRKQAHFSWENLEAAQNRLDDLRAMAALRWQPRHFAHDSGTFALEDIPNILQGYMSEDLDTPQALSFLSQVTTQLNTVHIQEDMLDHFEKMLLGIDALLGLNLSETPDISDDDKQLIKQREEARSNKDWQLSDTLRDQLKERKIGLNDFEHGVIWYPLR